MTNQNNEILNELRRSIVWMDSVLSHLDEAVFVVNQDLKILFANQALGTLVHKPPVLLLGYSLKELAELLGKSELSHKLKDVFRLNTETVNQLVNEYTIALDGKECRIELLANNIPHLNQTVVILRDVTARYNAERANLALAMEQQERLKQDQIHKLVEKNEERLRLIIDSVKDYAIFSLDTTGNIISWNEGAERIYGYTAQEAIGDHISLLFPDTVEGKRESIEQLKYVRSHERLEKEGWRRRKDGSLFLAHIITAALYDERGTFQGYSKITHDITESKKTENALKESEERFRTLVREVEDYAIFRIDPEGKIVSWNEGVQYILGYTEEEIIGKPLSIIYTPEDIAAHVPEQELQTAIATGRAPDDKMHVRKDGSVFHATGAVTAIRDENGKLRGFSKVLRDITERKEAEEIIRHQAFHDALTGLPNRKALDERFVLAQSMAIRNKQKLALMFLDLDRFKNINDTLGHGIGDLILKEVADRLTSVMRQIDTVARLGGDEFIILLNEISSSRDAIKVADKILQIFETTMRVQDQSLHVSTSIGIAIFPADGQDIYTLLKNADTALYRAKDAGRNRYQFYNYNMNLRSHAKLALEQDLRTAVTHRQLQLFYQPFISLQTGEVAGVEALVRWSHPKLGLLSPYDFIPLAEETGMIVSIGNWILKSACKQTKRWSDEGLPLQMAVNLSARQFAEAKLVDIVSEVLEEAKLEPAKLELEITESIAMENISRTSSKLNDLKQMGVSITIDDFGTGYSSLSYLKRFPVHKLKIDRSFVKHAITDQQDTTIIKAIISMGHSLGLKICAEGVEDEQQRTLLTSLDCDMMQGYLISKPVSAQELTEWLNT